MVREETRHREGQGVCRLPFSTLYNVYKLTGRFLPYVGYVTIAMVSLFASGRDKLTSRTTFPSSNTLY
jgi:hypothetical protein